MILFAVIVLCFACMVLAEGATIRYEVRWLVSKVTFRQAPALVAQHAAPHPSWAAAIVTRQNTTGLSAHPWW